MDIDLSVLRLMEREREIPFDELVAIIEQAILTAYLKHTGQPSTRTAPFPRGVELDRKTGHVAIYVPELDEDGVVIGEAEDSPSDFGRIARVRRQAGHQPAAARHRRRPRARGVQGPRGRHRRRRHPAGPEPAHDPRGPRHGRGDPAARGAGSRRGIHARLPHPRLRDEREQGPQGPVDHRVPHASVARPQAVRARGARDRQRRRRDHLARPRGRPPHQDRRARRTSPA